MSSFSIEQFLDLSTYATEERISRRKNNSDLKVSNTNEFFTPYSIVKTMADKVSEEKWNNPESNFLEPCFGNGQFLVYIIYNKIMHGSTWEQALSHTWGVELLESNVKETKNRILEMFKLMDITFNIEEAMSIMDNNLVSSDFFRWCFEEWRPYTDEEYYKTDIGKKELAKLKKLQKTSK